MSRAALLAALDPAWVRDPLYRAAGQLPAVDWRFAQDRSLVDRIRGLPLTFTRTTGRTWVQADGTNGTLGANEPAFIYRNGVSLGLDVWDTRTNLFLNSSAPATQNITVTAAAHTLSFKGTGTITLSGASTAGPLVGTSATDRVVLTLTPSAGSLTLTLSGTITEPQLELGSNASPFIPTAGTSVQRTGDVPTSTDLSWYIPGGVFFAEFALASTVATGGARIFEVSNGSTDFVRFRVAGGTSKTYDVFAGGAEQAAFGTGSISTAATKGAFAVAANAFAVSENGGAPSVDTSGSVPSGMNAIGIGCASAGSSQMQGTIARFAYFPPGPAAQRLQRLTS